MKRGTKTMGAPQRQEKNRSLFDSLWFSAVASVIAVVALVNNVVTNYLSGNYYQNSILIIFWLIVSYHYIRATIKASIGGKPE